MRSVADDVRDESRRRTAALSPEERVRLALELGDADVVVLSDARHMTADAARAHFSRTRRIGRQPSCANDD
jgi:hypothetical protein